MEITQEVNPKIYILLPVHNRKNITLRFINCLLEQTYSNYHLILIDDGSADGTSEMVKKRLDSVTIIKGKGNWWWAGSLQQGYKWLMKKEVSNNDIVVIINDDTIIDNKFLETGVEILSRHEKTLLGAQAYSLQDNRLIDSGVNVDWRKFCFSQAKSPEKINCLSTRGLFLFKKDFLNLGGFYPRLLPHYSSDYEFTIRAHSKGMKLITDASLKLYEDEETTGQHLFEKTSAILHIKEIFAKRSVRNPLYITSFILLSCPWRWKIRNIFKVWKGIFMGGVRKILKKIELSL